MKSQHGRWVCWMSTGRTNSLMWKHTHLIWTWMWKHTHYLNCDTEILLTGTLSEEQTWWCQVIVRDADTIYIRTPSIPVKEGKRKTTNGRRYWKVKNRKTKTEMVQRKQWNTHSEACYEWSRTAPERKENAPSLRQWYDVQRQEGATLLTSRGRYLEKAKQNRKYRLL